MDWNKSGEWSGWSVCPDCLGGAIAPEHVLIDFPVPAGFSGPLSGLMPLGQGFVIGPNPGYIWTRFTITPNMVDDGWAGDREFSDGESEDYLLKVDAAPVQHECDWNPGDPHKMHHAQEPDLQDTGIDVDMSWTSLADDFKCSETGHITDIHFWGSFRDDCLPPGGPASLTLQVTIYSDIPATADRHSMPGDPVWGPRTFEPCTYSVRRMKDGPEGWYDPATEWYEANNHQQAYQYNICVNDDEAFRQEKGTIYWLAIEYIVDVPGIEPEYTFGWKTTMIDLAWNDDAVYRLAAGGWAEMFYPDGHRYQGESLNLAFVITGEAVPPPDMDWGDAPDPPYPTLAASIGASHIIDLRTYMGNTVDADPDGQPTAAADGDDTDADGDDEDGVTFDTPLIPGQMAQITVNASIGGAFISVWIDFDADGNWTQATDYVVQSVTSVAGDNVFLIPVPAGTMPGTQAYVRVRFTTMPQIGFAGPAPNGEVEDYVVVIEEPYEPKPPVPHLKWSQPPIEIDPIPGQMPTYCGWDEPSWRRIELMPPVQFCPPRAADDFRCLGRMPITSVHWWGSHYGWDDAGAEPPLLPVGWQINFWSNVPAGADGAEFSRPGDPLKTINVDDIARVAVETVGRDYFGDFHPRDVCYQYTLYLEPDEYFWQNRYVEENADGTIGDTVFWISIQALYPEGEIAYPWGWKTRPWSWMDDGVRSKVIWVDPFPLCVWDPIEASICGAEPESFDLAFELDTDPDYIKWEQPFTGLRHWPHYEDEESMAWEREGSPNKWEQLPDPYWPGLHCHDFVNGSITIADDWDCDGGDVTDLHWYGNYETNALGQEMRGRGISSFHLSIHDPDPTVACLPGHEVWGMDVPFASISETDTGLVNREGCKIYLYEYDLRDPFPQIEGNKYWFDISAKCVEPLSPAIWRWQEAGRSPTPILCGAAERNDPMPGVWRTIIWPPVPPDNLDRYSDMAFAITSGPGEPEINIQRLVADDWACTTRQPVTAAVWWGSYIGYRYNACECPMVRPPVRPSYFYLTMWTDVPADSTDPESYSHPGRKVWEYKAYDYDEVLVGFDKHPEDVPGQPYGREPVFRYSVRLPSDAWFHQEEEDAIYWFSAVAVYREDTDPSYMWGWTNHEHMFNDDAVAGHFDPANGEWYWEELFDQTRQSEDMSFILFTEPGCFPSSYSTYLDWLAAGKPNCWCGIYGTPQWPYQCDGDAANDVHGRGYIVYTTDLLIFQRSWKSKIGDANYNPCADFDHMAHPRGYRVYTSDLGILQTNWKKKSIAADPVNGLPGDCPRPE